MRMTLMALRYFKMLRLSIAFLLYWNVQCFWPPTYNIDLHQNETFEISEDMQMEDDQIAQDEDEMIEEDELKTFHFNEDPHKFARLHQVAFRKEENVDDYKQSRLKYAESIWEHEETMPKEAGFVEEDGSLSNSIPIFSFKDIANMKHNKLVKHAIENKSEATIQQIENRTEIKRQNVESGEQGENYNYDDMKEKFEENLAKEKAEKDVLKYTEVKEKESARDSIRTIWKEKDDVNCTLEEMRGIGATAFLCLLKEPDKNKAAKFFSRLGKISLIWLIVYVIVAIPLWCTRGWCCCCFRCMFCRPRVRIDLIKEYYTQNPPGVVHDDYENIIEYQPTSYEKYYQKQLEKELKKLISY